MSTNRRKFLGAIGATGLVGSIAAQQANAQSQPISTASSTSNRELAGKVAIVTGARANLGRGFAEALAKHGADIVVHYHRESTKDQGRGNCAISGSSRYACCPSAGRFRSG